EGRDGYRRWRADLALRHATAAAAIAAEVGYPPEVVERVRALVQKRGLKVDPEAQLLEDTACLVFLEHELAGFAARHERARVIEIVRKTWTKMSPAGRTAASAVTLGQVERAIVDAALADPAAAPTD